MKVFIVGEDPVTYAIIKRMLAHCSQDFEIISELPARGGQIKSKINEFNALAAHTPVILLTDLDATICAPELKGQLINQIQNINFIFNVAVDEAEAWLMADRVGFSGYLGVDIDEIPQPAQKKQGGRIALTEMDFRYKSSMFLTHELIKKSRKKELILQLTPKEGASKGPEYNNGILPFIQEKWNIQNARENSDSLSRMISRLLKLLNP